MYKVFPLQDSPRRRALCKACGIPFYEVYPAYLIETEEGDVGLVPFYLEGGTGYIPEIGVKDSALAKDFEPFFVACRQTLNQMNLCGADSAILQKCSPQQHRLSAAVGFSTGDDGCLTMNLRGFFEKEHCRSAATEHRIKDID